METTIEGHWSATAISFCKHLVKLEMVWIES